MASTLDGVFLIDANARTVRCYVQRPYEEAWADVLARRVLPRVAMLVGATAIHGASAATSAGGLLLLGASGAGKSTLSAFLGSQGWQILSDDISLLWDPATPWLAPSTTGVCVWADSREGLGLPENLCLPLAGYPGKVRYVPGREVTTAPVPLKALVFLSREAGLAGPVAEPLSPAEGLIRATHQRIRFNPADESGQETVGNFKRMSQAVRVTPCYRLRYPGDYGALPSVAQALRNLLQ